MIINYYHLAPSKAFETLDLPFAGTDLIFDILAAQQVDLGVSILNN